MTGRYKEFRQKAGLSILAAADKMGVSSTSILNWEHGKRHPNGRNIVEMAKLYNCSADELLGLKQD